MTRPSLAHKNSVDRDSPWKNIIIDNGRGTVLAGHAGIEKTRRQLQSGSLYQRQIFFGFFFFEKGVDRYHQLGMAGMGGLCSQVSTLLILDSFDDKASLLFSIVTESYPWRQIVCPSKKKNKLTSRFCFLFLGQIQALPMLHRSLLLIDSKVLSQSWTILYL